MKMPDIKKVCIAGGNMEKKKSPRFSVDSLLDISSRNVAEFIPFQYIEERYECRIPGKYKKIVSNVLSISYNTIGVELTAIIIYFPTNITEPVQERIIYWSFPRHEGDICRYSSLSRVPASILSSSDDTAHNNTLTIDSTRTDYEQGLLIPTTNASSNIAGSRNFIDESRDPRRQPDGSKGHKSQHPFYRGIKLLEQGCVQNVLQVGKLKLFRIWYIYLKIVFVT